MNFVSPVLFGAVLNYLPLEICRGSAIEQDRGSQGSALASLSSEVALPPSRACCPDC